jgi:hypothetical protein
MNRTVLATLFRTGLLVSLIVLRQTFVTKEAIERLCRLP